MHEKTVSPLGTVVISAARGQVSLTESWVVRICTGRQHRSEMRGRVYAPMSVRHWSRTHVTEMIEETATEVIVIALPPAAVSVRAQSHRVLYRTVGSVSGKMAQPVISGSDLHCRRAPLRESGSIGGNRSVMYSISRKTMYIPRQRTDHPTAGTLGRRFSLFQLDSRQGRLIPA